MALNSKQQMKPYHKNPRRINKKQFEQLKENLLYLGDLSGIVHDLNSNEIVGGNQRSSVFDVNECDVEIVHQYDYPDEQGTIAHGFIIWKDKRYTYRQVRWTPKQCKQANITANRLGGEWDFDELANWDMSDLLTWGFEESDFPFDVAPATDGEWGDALNKLPDEDRAPFQQITFTLHDTQVKIVKSALSIASKLSNFEDSPNENGNGNSLSFICEAFITEHGNS